MTSDFHDIHLNVAGLGIKLDASACPSPITLLAGHEKFIQPAANPQVAFAYQGLSGNDSFVRTLYLTIKDRQEAVSQVPDVALCKTDIWEMWVNEKRHNFTFFAPRGKPPCRLTVSQDFVRGELTGDFASLSGESCYPLLGLDNLLFINWLGSLGDVSLHASAVSMDGRGYAFFGVSGAGKSTLAGTLARDHDMPVLAEDQVFLRLINDQFWIFGTPWHENTEMCSPLGVPLSKLYFLERSNGQAVTRLSPGEAVTRILQTAFIPYYRPDLLPGIIERLVILTQTIPVYSLHYQLGSDPWALIDRV